MNLKNAILIGGVISLLLVFYFWGNIFFSIDKPLRDHDDITWQYFIFENNLTKLTHFDFQNLFDTRMFYPRKNTLAMGNSLLGQSIMAIPVYLITHDVISSANSVVLIDFFLSFLGAYLLAFKLTKNIAASTIAGVIYTYNPYVMAHVNHEHMVLQWMPFTFLALENLFEFRSCHSERSEESLSNTSSKQAQRSFVVSLLRMTYGEWIYSLLLFFLFVLNLISSFYYVFFTVIGLSIYAVSKAVLGRFSLLFSPAIIVCIMLSGIMVFFFLKPFIDIKNTYHMERPIELIPLYSAHISDFIFTSPQNRMYGWMINNPHFRSFRDSFSIIHYTEHVLFPGLTAYFLTAVACYLFVRKKLKRVGIYIILLIVAIVLSFGPYIFIGNLKIPAPYLLLYKLVPFTNLLRVPTRIMILGYLSMGILGAFAFTKILNYFDVKKKWLFGGIVVSFLILEYSHKQQIPYTIPQETRKFYSWLDAQPHVKVIIELPIANDLTDYPALERTFMDDSQYMLYGIYHKKRIVNGNFGLIPLDALDLGMRLTINFPTLQKLVILRQMGVDTIIVHKDEYKSQQIGKDVIDKLDEFGVPKIYTSSLISAYSISNKFRTLSF